ncbi:MAG TPA: M13 family metallopeptidase [Gammaproteobacteria bacterium]|nr:M13 family metallopeptidase [Gammaproteobacteria bacterium]
MVSWVKPIAIVAAAAGLAGCGPRAGSDEERAAAKSAPASLPAAERLPVFDVAELDDSIAACTDFNGFVNSRWIAANPIPPDRTRWGAFDALAEQSLENQHTLVERAARNAAQTAAGSIERQIGYLYRSGMDEAAIDAAGFDPIKPKLAEIAALKTPDDVTAWLRLSFSRGDQQLFFFSSGADYKNAARQIAYVNQGGLGLPSPDYYSKDEYREIRTAYVAHMARFFELAGVPADPAARSAASVLELETKLAGYSLQPVELRDPQNQYHFVSLDEALRTTPRFDWRTFFVAQGVAVDGFSLSQPKFFAGLNELLASAPVERWRDYLALHVIADAAPYLSEPFQQEDFEFSGKTLNGQPEQRARWKRVLGAVNGGMGQALGQLYVAEYFPPDAKARAEELVANVRAALKARIANLEWMSDATKQKALAKWEKFLPKIGYPDTWRDWSGLSVTPDRYYDNVMAAGKFNYQYDIAKIGTPTDRKEWSMTPQTVNAYYNPTDNTINFPAAILQPPFFYAKGDDAINYGGIGGTIGHESSHGFDDEGSQFDGDGNNLDWWTKEDRAEFDARAAKLVEQFDAYAPIADQPDKHVNGRLTLGENIADLGGLSVAYDALRTALEGHPAEAGSKIDGYTQDQRLFMNWARIWRSNIRDKRQLVLLNVDPHAPAKLRAIGPPSNMPSFAAAFGCSAGDAMVRSGEAQVKIW